MLMTTLVMNQKQNTFQFWKNEQMRAVVKETLPKSVVSDLEKQKIMMDLCKISMRTYLETFLVPRHMLCQFRNAKANKCFKPGRAPNIAPGHLPVM